MYKSTKKPSQSVVVMWTSLFVEKYKLLGGGFIAKIVASEEIFLSQWKNHESLRFMVKVNPNSLFSKELLHKGR